jgi:rhodanese-related sulfurtransferase
MNTFGMLSGPAGRLGLGFRTIRTATAAAAAFIALISAAPAIALSDQDEQARSQCAPGTDPQLQGSEYVGGLSAIAGALTPTAAAGATTVSVEEAACLLKAYGDSMLVIAALGDEERLPRAIPGGAWAAAGTFDDRVQKGLAETIGLLTGINHGRRQDHPILVYCHHERCFLSYNVVLRLAAAGYRNLFWMRPGIAGWKAAGYSTAMPHWAELAIEKCNDAAHDAAYRLVDEVATGNGATLLAARRKEATSAHRTCTAAARTELVADYPHLASLYDSSVAQGVSNIETYFADAVAAGKKEAGDRAAADTRLAELKVREAAERLRRAGALPEAQFGREYAVTTSNSNRSDSGEGYVHEVKFRGTRGEKIKVTIRDDDEADNLRLVLRPISVRTGAQAERIDRADEVGPKKKDFLWIQDTYELPEDGEYIYGIWRSATDFISTNTGFRQVQVPPAPYKARFDRVR